jgi:hypothetical protein
MIFSENRCPPRAKPGAGFFGIMLYLVTTATRRGTIAILDLGDGDKQPATRGGDP